MFLDLDTPMFSDEEAIFKATGRRAVGLKGPPYGLRDLSSLAVRRSLDRLIPHQMDDRRPAWTSGERVSEYIDQIVSAVVTAHNWADVLVRAASREAKHIYVLVEPTRSGSLVVSVTHAPSVKGKDDGEPSQFDIGPEVVKAVTQLATGRLFSTAAGGNYKSC